jgi:eukaryotic-like serine/threonine-protein kinase
VQPDLIAGRYRVIRAIASGGMGTLWLCRDEVLSRRVAVKQIHGLPGEQVAAVRSLREARLAAALNHENAVSVYDVVDEASTTWIVMEYVPSRTLAQVVKAEGPLRPARLARIGAQVAAALTAAHALGIVHRDVKPSNVLVGKRDLAKITDFGIARGHADEQLTLTGFVTGTPAYFAPELARGEDPSPASDVWALGATLYAGVEGVPPFGTGGSPLALLARIATEPPPRPTHAGVLTPILKSMLARDPRSRATMEAVRRDLSALAGDVESARAAQRGRAYDDTTLQELPVARPIVDGAPPLATAEVSAATAVPTIDGETTQPSPRRPRDGHGRPSPALLVVGLALLLVLGLGGALVWGSTRSSGSSGTTALPGRTSHHSTTTRDHPKGTGQDGAPTTSAPPGTPVSTPPSTPPTTMTTSPAFRPPSPRAVDFVTSYFATVPGDLDKGWLELAPSMRSRIGRASYDNFWESINAVDLADVRTTSASSVEYEITYHFSDGRVVLEHQRIDLQPHGNSFWILGDTVLSSTTLRS